MFSTRFSPMTARPIRPMSALAVAMTGAPESERERAAFPGHCRASSLACPWRLRGKQGCLPYETTFGFRRRPAQPDEHLGAGHRHLLARADVEGYALPAPRLDVQPQRDEGFHLGVGRHAFLLAVAAELPADHVGRLQRRDGLEHLHLLVAD